MARKLISVTRPSTRKTIRRGVAKFTHVKGYTSKINRGSRKKK